MQINLIKVIRLHQNTSNKKKEKKKRQILWTEPHPLEREFENDNKKKFIFGWHKLRVSNNILFNEYVCVSERRFVRESLV